jgi:uncharacterized membrane protein YqgA involved in biofilm formation
MRGTLFNTATVAAGAIVGWAIGSHIAPEAKVVVMSGLGLVTVGLGIKLFLDVKNILVIAGAVALGGLVGALLGIDPAITACGEWAKHRMGGGAHFTDAFVGTFILYCVGPMTLLGCLQDGIEGKWDLLAIKGLLDGIGAIFFAAALDPFGVLATAFAVLLFQGALTLSARFLKGVAQDKELIGDASAAGGLLLLAIGLNLMEVKNLHVANYLPALVFAPAIVLVARRIGSLRRKAT